MQHLLYLYYIAVTVVVVVVIAVVVDFVISNFMQQNILLRYKSQPTKLSQQA